MTASPGPPSPLDPDIAPSWATPIAVGATISFFGTVLLLMSASFNGACAVASCGCLGPASFLPYGFAVGTFAWRRDPRLSAGQAFNLTFIAVGLGMLLWAGVTAMQIDAGSAAESARDYMREQLEQNPDLDATEGDIEEWSEMAGRTAPYMPLAFAFFVSLLAAVVGMITVSILQRRAVDPRSISPDPNDPPGP